MLLYMKKFQVKAKMKFKKISKQFHIIIFKQDSTVFYFTEKKIFPSNVIKNFSNL